MLEKPLPETLIRWSNTDKHDRDPKTLRYYEKMILFFTLTSYSIVIKTENTRKLGELQEGEKRQTFLSERLKKIDEVTAKIFYHLFIKFASLASLIGGYQEFSTGLLLGVAYPLCNFISRGYLSKGANLALTNIWFRLICYPFYRRNSFRTDESSQNDVKNFVNADAFGRMRMIGSEALLGGFQAITHAGLLKSFQIGKEFSEGLADKFFTRLAISSI